MKISDPTSGIVDRNGACNKQNKSKSLFSLATKTYAMIASNRVKKVFYMYKSIHILKHLNLLKWRQQIFLYHKLFNSIF